MSSVKIAKLGPMHPGSICQQRNRRRAKDGSVALSRPYTIYTFKAGGKTITFGIKDDQGGIRLMGPMGPGKVFLRCIARAGLP
ncbi:hypothetical protein LLG95_17210 [bacterium]|nr:hypothetical protein [bacterium]